MRGLMVSFGVFLFSVNSFAFVDIDITRGVNSDLKAMTVIALEDNPRANTHSRFSTEEIWQMLKPNGTQSPEKERFTEWVSDSFKLSCGKSWPEDVTEYPNRACDFKILDSWLKFSGNVISMQLTGSDAQNVLNEFIKPYDGAYVALRQTVSYNGAVRNFELILNWHKNTVSLRIEKADN